MEGSSYSLMIVDDHPVIHSGLKTLLASEERLSINATANSATEAVDLLETLHLDLILLDLSLGDADGTYLIQKIHTQYPDMKILIYSMSEERLFGNRVASAGAHGYVMKSSSPSLLKKAIYGVLKGHLFFSNEVLSRLRKQKEGKPTKPQSVLDHLSNREFDIFKLVGEGLDTVNISHKLDISKNTVDTHRINIKKKLELSSGKALDRMAYEVITKGILPKE